MNNLILHRISIPSGDFFSPVKTFDCGQCFRFDEREGCIEGVTGMSLLRIPLTESTGSIEYYCSSNADLFFDPEHSYSLMAEEFIAPFSGRAREALENAELMGRGIRILRQSFWEALVSFIISQNNNIPRIKKNIASISEQFGTPFEAEGRTYYAFPTAEQLLDAGETGLNECRLGFRVKYILDACRRLISGELCEEELMTLPTDEVLTRLQAVQGVGPKVASCVTLYGMGRLETVPVDVWMKKVFAKYFDSTPDLGVWGGVAQQYLFYNERYLV